MFELWLRDPNVAQNQEMLSMLLARIAREKHWPEDRRTRMIASVLQGEYKVEADKNRGGCIVRIPEE